MDLADNAITSAKINKGAITEDKLAADLKQKIQNRGNQFVTVCNAHNIGKHNLNGWTCIHLHVTNDYHCINSLKDSVERQRSGLNFMCRDGYSRVWLRVAHCVGAKCT